MPRWPTAPYSSHRTGCYGCKRLSPSDGACGVHGYPCTHWGVDTFTIGGIRDVWAPEAGIVVAVSDGSSPPFVGYGPGIVLLKGASGVYHLLAHLQAGTTVVRVGQTLAEGAPIAKFDPAMGHCHYEVRRAPTGPSETNTINPEEWHRAASGGSGLVVILALGGLFALGIMLARHRAGERLF
jgi:murein DD-endopeptidase MepM/ murein hydrolase activator NlpD